MSARTNSESRPADAPVRHDRLMQEYEHDTYKLKGKLPEPTACPGCGAIFHKGHWQWAAAPAGANSETCPACHRIADKFPAGYLSVKGEFLRGHREELVQLIKHVGEREKSQHPLERVMEIGDEADGLLVTTTGIHLARSLGQALHHAYQGELAFHHNEGEKLLRVRWQR